MKHTQACPFCDKYVDGGCTIFTDVCWVDRIGGCGMFPSRPLPHGHQYIDGKIYGPGRTGQQKQKHEDRKYRNKNDGRKKYKSNVERGKE